MPLQIYHKTPAADSQAVHPEEDIAFFFNTAVTSRVDDAGDPTGDAELESKGSAEPEVEPEVEPEGRPEPAPTEVAPDQIDPPVAAGTISVEPRTRSTDQTVTPKSKNPG